MKQVLFARDERMQKKREWRSEYARMIIYVG